MRVWNRNLPLIKKCIVVILWFFSFCTGINWHNYLLSLIPDKAYLSGQSLLSRQLHVTVGSCLNSFDSTFVSVILWYNYMYMYLFLWMLLISQVFKSVVMLSDPMAIVKLRTFEMMENTSWDDQYKEYLKKNSEQF